MAIRCFIAAELPAPIRTNIIRSIEPLRSTGADVKWVKEEQVHITLKFLGETDEQIIPSLQEALVKKISPYTPFYITISALGCFPDRRRPRVLWIGLRDVSDLIRIHRDIEDEMSHFGFQKEKRGFSPHITVGRMRSQKGMTDLMRKLDDVEALKMDRVLINSISLMRSELKPAGAEYTTLAEIPFRRRSDVQ